MLSFRHPRQALPVNPRTLALLIVLALYGGCGKDTVEPQPGTVGPEGGTFESPDGRVTVTVPAGAVSQPITITVETTQDFPASTRLVSGTTYRIGPAGTQFAVPVQVTIGYDEEAIPSGLAESSLGLYKVEVDAWQRQGVTTVDAAGNRASGSVSGFSVFGVLGVPAPAVVRLNEVENRASDSRHAGDFVELFVLEDGALDEFRLVLTAMDGERYGDVVLQGDVRSGDLVLIGASGIADRQYDFAGLQDGPGGVQLLDAGGSVHDAVEWGGLNLGVAEGAAEPDFPLAALIQRVMDGEDSDDNATDFCVQFEDRATPGAPNEPCAVPTAFLDVTFLGSIEGEDMQELALETGQGFVFDAWVKNLAPPATGPATQLAVAALEAFDPNIVVALDLDPFPTSVLQPAERRAQRVAVVCLADGQTRVFKTATSPDDPRIFPALDLLYVSCSTAPTPVAGIPDPVQPTPPPVDAAVMKLTIISAFGDEIPDGGHLPVGQSVRTGVLIENIGTRWPLLDVRLPDIVPAGLGLERQGTWPRFVVIEPGSDHVELAVIFTCLEVGLYFPSASSNAVHYPGIVAEADDGFDVTCTKPEPPVRWVGYTSTLESFLQQYDPNTGQITDLDRQPTGEFAYPMAVLGLPDPIAFVRRPVFGDATGDIIVADEDGTNQVNITNHPAFYRRGSANAAATQLVVESDRDAPGAACPLQCDVFVMNLDGSGLQKIITGAGLPSFTPDGRVVYSTDGDGDGLWEIWIANGDGTGAALLIDDGDTYSYAEAAVSPDGTKLAVTRWDATFVSEIAVGDYDGNAVTNLVSVASEVGTGTFGNFNPTWSPGSDRIAFTSHRTGDEDIWIMNADGTNQVNITQTPTIEEFFPSWILP